MEGEINKHSGRRGRLSHGVGEMSRSDFRGTVPSARPLQYVNPPVVGALPPCAPVIKPINYNNRHYEPTPQCRPEAYPAEGSYRRIFTHITKDPSLLRSSECQTITSLFLTKSTRQCCQIHPSHFVQIAVFVTSYI